MLNTKYIFFLILLIFLPIKLLASNIITMEADTLKSDTKNNRVEADGSVVFTKDGNTISTDNVIYDKNKKIIFLNKRVKFFSKDKKTIFADNGVVDEKIETGKFNKAGLIFEDGISVIANEIEKISENEYISTDTNIYLCPDPNMSKDLSYDEIIKELKSEKRDIVSIYSKKSTINIKEKKIYLQNNQLRVFNIPILYWPTITTTRPFVDKVSGFSFPNFEKVDKYGVGVFVPFNWYVNDLLKIRFTFGLYSNFPKANITPVIKFKSLLNRDKGFTLIDGIFLRDKVYDSKTYRYIFEYKAKSQIDDNLFYDIDLNLVSDNFIKSNYLSDYDNFIKSEANLSYINFDNYNYINFNVLSFRELLEEAEVRQKETPYLLPSINSSYTYQIKNSYLNNLYFVNKTNVITSDLFNINDIKYNKINLLFGLTHDTILSTFRISTNLNLYQDFYFTNTFFNNLQNINKSDKVKNRTIPEINFDIRNLYILTNNTNVSFEPILQVYYSPKSNDYNLAIINEDSKESEINILNLFNGSRFNGVDRREYGLRINYGFVNNYYLTNDTKLSFKFGQAYKNADYKDTSLFGFKDNFSDILSGLNYSDSIFDISYLINFDKNNLNVNSNELIFNINLDKVILFGSYAYFNKEKIDNISKETNELSFGLKYNFLRKLNFVIIFNRDLITQTTRSTNIYLFYENNCIITGIELENINYVNHTRAKGHNIKLNFRIKNSMF